MVKHLALLGLVAACGKASLGGDTGGNVDAPVGGGGSDASISEDAPVSIDAAASACPNGRKVFLNFDGVTLTSDAAASDAVTNKARWLTQMTSTVPIFRQGAGTRDADILDITNGVKSRLSQTPIEVVTTRPANGPYVMILVGGQSIDNGGTVASAFGGAVNFHDCNDLVKSDVGWVADLANFGLNNVNIANYIVGAIGFGLGLDGATAQADCLCSWGNDCQQTNAACTLANNATSSITLGGLTACTAGTQNEIDAFSTGFCQ